MKDPQTVVRNAAWPRVAHWHGSASADLAPRPRSPGSFDPDDGLALRAFASAIRDYTRRHLPELLEILTANLTAHGIEIHWTDSVGQGRAIVERLLSEAGIGEFSQSRNPLHMGVPRPDGTPPTPRDRLVAAEAGLSGVDFAVAETGTLVLAENEGSARMCSTVHRLSIAVLELEKLVPRLDDIPPLLALHARSVCGRPHPVYVSLLSGPKHPGEKDGPDAVHLIILNNGHSRPASQPGWLDIWHRVRKAAHQSGTTFGTAIPGGRLQDQGPQWRLALLRQQMKAAGTEFLDARGKDWLAPFQQWLTDNGIPGCIYAPTTHLGQRIAAGWRGHAPLIPFRRPLGEWKEEFFAQAGAGITATHGGIAETGSLVLRSGPLEPRSISLVPPVHVALLDCSMIYGTLEQAMREQEWRNAMPSDLLLLSGPSHQTRQGESSTADGYGPRRLLVILVDGDPSGPGAAPPGGDVP